LDEDIEGVRLFKKSGIMFEDELPCVHEHLKVNGAVGSIDKGVDHFPFESMKKMMEKCSFYCDVESERWLKTRDVVTKKELTFELTWNLLKSFARDYIKKKSYRGGLMGFSKSLMHVFYNQVFWLYVWEKAKKSGKLVS
jgi:hypothetical protein